MLCLDNEIKNFFENSNYKLDYLPYRIPFIAAMRSKLCYELSKAYSNGSKFRLIEGAQNGITLKNPEEILRLFYAPKFFIESEKLLRRKGKYGDMVICTYDDKNTFYNSYVIMECDKKIFIKPKIHNGSKFSIYYILRMSPDEKIKMLEENAGFRQELINYSYALITTAKEKLTNSVNYSPNNNKELYRALLIMINNYTNNISKDLDNDKDLLYEKLSA